MSVGVPGETSVARDRTYTPRTVESLNTDSRRFDFCFFDTDQSPAGANFDLERGGAYLVHIDLLG